MTLTGTSIYRIIFSFVNHTVLFVCMYVHKRLCFVFVSKVSSTVVTYFCFGCFIFSLDFHENGSKRTHTHTQNTKITKPHIYRIHRIDSMVVRVFCVRLCGCVCECLYVTNAIYMLWILIWVFYCRYFSVSMCVCGCVYVFVINIVSDR